jgi:hypothetical protein
MQRYSHLVLLALALPGCQPNPKNNEPTVDVDTDGDGVPEGDDCDDTDIAVGDIRDDADCDGTRAAVDCDDSDPLVGDINDDADCDGAFIATDCDDSDPSLGSRVEDADCDRVLTVDDCDDLDPYLLARSDDGDCDGALTADDCDDNDAASATRAEDGDCDGIPTANDCDDNDPASLTRAEDRDCDGTPTADDCDDNDPWGTIFAEDQDCDGVSTANDCDDHNPSLLDQRYDQDCDGYLRGDDCDDESSAVHPGMAEVCGDDVDENCDGMVEPCLTYDAASCPSFLPLDSGAPISTSGWRTSWADVTASGSAGFGWQLGQIDDVPNGFFDDPDPDFDAATWLPDSDHYGGSDWAILSLRSYYFWSFASDYGYDMYESDEVQALSVACTTAGVVVARIRDVRAAGDWVHTGWSGSYSMEVYESLPLLLPATVAEGVTWRTEGLRLPFGSESFTAGFGASASGTTHTVVSCGLETIVGEERNVCHIDSVTDAGDTYAWAVGEGVWHVEDQHGTISGITAL